MGIKSRIKSIFSKKKTTEPVYQSSGTYQGPVPAGGVEKTFRQTGRTEGGYTPTNAGQPITTPTSPRPKSRGGGGSTNYQGPVPASASEEVFRETGETQGGMSVKPKPQETARQKGQRLFKPVGEIKAEYEEEALQGIAERQAKFINPYSTPAPSTGFTQAPFSSASGEQTFYFTPNKEQLKEASGFASSKFGELSGINKARAYYGSTLIGGVRGLESGSRQLGLAMGGGFALGQSVTKFEETRIVPRSIKVGKVGAVAEAISSSAVVSGGLSAVPKTPIKTTSLSATQSNKILTITKIEKPIAFNPIKGPTETDFAVSVSNIKAKPKAYTSTTFTSYKGQVSKSIETGTIKSSNINLPISKEVSLNIPSTKTTGLSIGKQFNSNKPYSARLSSSENIQFGNDFTIGKGRSNLIEQNKRGTEYFINPKQKILTSQYSFNIPKSSNAESGFTSFSGGSKQTPFSATFTKQYTPNIVSTLPLKITQSFKPVVSSIPKSTQVYQTPKTVMTSQSLINEPQYSSIKSGLNFIPTSIIKEEPKQKSFTRTSSIVIQQPKSSQSSVNLVSPAIAQPPFTSSATRTRQIFRTPNPNINPPINIFQGGGGKPFGFKLPSLGFSEGLGVSRIGSRKQVTGYTPSFSALAFGFKGKKKKGVETGFNFRPFINFNKKRKK